MSTLTLARNVDVDLDDDAATWPFEALVSVLDRGLVADWQPIIRALRAQPWGPFALRVLDAAALADDERIAALFDAIIASIRVEFERAERDEVAATIRDAVRASGLTQAAFAARIGTSGSRLNTYCTGQVMPSAAMLVRIRWATAHL